jgi:DNA mismatch repair protein MutL
MAVIRHMDERLIGKIAAGEVVERPASVVKELVENALDAQATDIRVELAAGGKASLRVTDNGTGMGPEDALLAFDRHATSKIQEFEDLERVATLGFRGEALSSIAAVARVELVTATEPGDGHRVRVEGGKVTLAEPAAHAGGTTIEVASLFFNVPARRKFLKTPATELRRALEVVQGYALANPEVRFAVEHEGRRLLDTPAAGAGDVGARQRIGQVFGASLAEGLIAIPGDDEVWGFVGDPSTGRSRRYFVFVNRRLLRDRAILGMYYRAVRDVWKTDQFPALFLFVDVPPEEIDVNVHPQKAEVRFRDGRLLGRLSRRLRDTLAAARGEVEASFESPGAFGEAPLAWRGLGSRPAGGAQDGALGQPGDGPDDGPGGRAGAPWPGRALGDERSYLTDRIAEAVYAPARRAPIPLSGRSGEVRSFRLLGQYKGTILLLEGPDGLYLIDQHVAHERILYERFRRQLDGERVASQTLLEPLLLELGAAEALRLRELADELEGCGFALRELSADALGLTEIPAALTADEAERLLLALIDQRPGGEEASQGLRARMLDAMAAGMACRAAVKMHEPLPPQQLEALVTELFEAEQPFACPHGRPIVLRMTDAELERRFERR